MEIDIHNNTPQPGEKYWQISIFAGQVGETGNKVYDVDYYTVGEAIEKLREVMLANTPSGENEESSNP